MEPLVFRRVQLDWSRPYIVGVINVTPDSFSDGGAYGSPSAAVAQGRALAEAGADILDLGGESTRPGAAPVSASEELERVLPVIEGLLREVELPLAIDTVKAEVARVAVGAGVDMVNDISGGHFDPAMIETVAALGAPYVLGHVRGRTLAEVHGGGGAGPAEVERILDELVSAVKALPAPLRSRTLVDPGLGFGKGAELNLALLGRCAELRLRTGCPVYVGPSRKRFIGATLPVDSLRNRDLGTIGAALAAIEGGAQLVRVHEVGMLKPALVIYERARRLR